MCYAFTTAMQSEAAVLAEENSRPRISVEQAEMATAQDGERSQSRKRSASTALEHGPPKVTKTWDGGERSREGSVATVVTVGDGKEDGEESVEALKEQIQDLRNRAITKMRGLSASKKEVEDERDELRGANTVLEMEVEKLQQQLKASEGSANAKQIAKRIEQDIGKKYEKKMSDLQTKHDKALQQKLASKHSGYQKKVDELKEKREAAEDEAKEAKADFAKREKDRKKDHDQLKKDLRAEHQAEIKKFKEDNSSEVKEKRDLVKMYEKKLHAHKKQNEESGVEIGTLQHDNAKLEAFKERAGKEIRGLRDAIKKKDDFALSIGQEYAAKTASLEGKLVFEGKRWAKQKECCDELAQKLVSQQRTNFILRNANDGKAEKLQKMIVEMARLRGLPGTGGGAETGGQGRSEEIEVLVDEKKNLVEGREREASQTADGAETAMTNGDEVDEAPMLADAKDPTSVGNGAVQDVSTQSEKVDTPIAEDALISEKSGHSEGAKTPVPVGETLADIVTLNEKVDSPTEQPTTPKEDKDEIFNPTVADSEVMDIDEEANIAEQSLDPTATAVSVPMDKTKQDDITESDAMSASEQKGLGDGGGKQSLNETVRAVSVAADQGEQQQRGWNHARMAEGVE